MQFTERQLSNLWASTSEHCGAFQDPHVRRHARPCKRQKTQVCSSSTAFAGDAHNGRSAADVEMHWAGQTLAALRSRNKTTRNTLADYDYSVYQQMTYEQITEDCLWDRLEPMLDYLPEEDILQVKQALTFANAAHAGQRRKSGEPFITHPVEVTRILAELCMDRDSLIAGILHDTVEDNPGQINFDEIEILFGDAVRVIVEGETKFSKLGQLSSAAGKPVDLKARDLQHLFLAMTKEVRIIVVKLADRLHNMRTLSSLAKHKQKKIADETLQVFAPLARLLGLYSIKEELEELGFRYSNPDEYAKLRRHLDHLSQEYEPVVQRAQKALGEMLNKDDYLCQRSNEVQVVASQKSVYSIHRKLEETGGSASDVTGFSQLCVIIPQKELQDSFLYGTGSQLCYHVMGLVHTMWAPIPGSIKDYIATPKRNGYQSLHTTVLPLGSTPLVPLEVLIRTCKMQELADFGIAGETWVTREAWGARSDNPARHFVSPGISCLPRQSIKSKGVVSDLMKLLPKLVGLNSDLLTGNALLAVNGTVLQAPRLGVNGYRALSMQKNIVAKAALMASGHSAPTAETVKRKASSHSGRLDKEVMRRREHWLKSIIEWQEEFMHSLSAREFVEGITDDLLGRGVFVFTPSGDLLRLPKDSTTVDFAYHVHTDVGNQMVGAKVNGKLVNPEHLVQNAEVIEVLTYDGPPTALAVSRHHEWAKFAKSRTARHKLSKYLKENWHLLPEQIRQSEHNSSSSVHSSKQSEPRTEKVLWLNLNAENTMNLLADVAQIIGKNGHSVKAFSQVLDSSSGAQQMQFSIEGEPEKCKDMCRELCEVPLVSSCRVL